MNDRWFKEIELQKVFSMSPKEAYCTVASSEGLKSKEIAEMADISPSTVRTMIQRGADKMKKSQKTVKIVVVKGDPLNEGIGIKIDAVRILFAFAERALGARVQEGNSLIYLDGLDAANPGDVAWMKDNVFRKADIYGARTSKEAEMRKNSLTVAYSELDEGRNAFGYGVIKYFLDQMYLKYDIFE